MIQIQVFKVPFPASIPPGNWSWPEIGIRTIADAHGILLPELIAWTAERQGDEAVLTVYEVPSVAEAGFRSLPRR